ncbi:hypothetical protein B0H67DRAFT_483521 [Lasiosphaeris hirsuta]|uniref:Uncharacterized protein n=1 Tax=Lasiosphaeris hirsuta TaxID=260670 RepID=A0AA40AP12_9PEZI|nr:hypothetical protein B0H67DRAFT_483521 [Lasiosphaeris hirsuta]
MANSSNLACLGPDSLPDAVQFPIPKDMNVALLPGTNGSASWMVDCCEPNPVSLVNGCYLWCEIPPSHIHKGSDGKAHSDFDSCLVAHNRPNNESSILYIGLNAASGKGVSMKCLGAWVLCVSGLLAFGL